MHGNPCKVAGCCEIRTTSPFTVPSDTIRYYEFETMLKYKKRIRQRCNNAGDLNFGRLNRMIGSAIILIENRKILNESQD